MRIKLACFAALAFWAPDILVHAFRGNLFAYCDVLLLTVAMPLVAFLFWTAGAKSHHLTRGTVAMPMLSGIWLLGGLCMSLGATFSSGGFAAPAGPHGQLFAIAMSFFPPVTFMMATYDGSLAALLLVSLVLILDWIRSY